MKKQLCGQSSENRAPRSLNIDDRGISLGRLAQRHKISGREAMQCSEAFMPAKTRKICLALASALAGLGMTTQVGATTTVTQISYDAGDHIASVTDPRGLVTTYAYDGLGQLWGQASPDTGTTTYNYDAYGRRSSMTRADNTQTTYGYDSLSRVTSISAGGQAQSFTYDSCTNGVGRLCSAADATGTTSYSYSPEGWLTGRGFSISGTTYSLGYSYNALGQIASVVYPDGNQAIYSYTLGVVSGISLNVGGTTVTGASGITYQPMNAAMSGWTSSNGIINTLSYDSDGRLTAISAGNIESFGLSYDAANRIVGITNGIDGSMTQNFGYDDESRLVSVYSGTDNENFQYDLDGNRTSQTVNGSYLTFTIDSSSNRLNGVGGNLTTSYGYDLRGNTTQINGSSTYQYNAFNRLSAVGPASDYVSPEGVRLRKVSSIGTTYFAPQDGAILAENDNGIWIDYIWLNGRLVGRLTGATVDAVHDDQVGRPQVVTDSSGTMVWLARNYPFEREVALDNIGGLNIGFPGQYYDADRGLWNNGRRDYNANLGRYVESDPIGLQGGFNTYAYVGNSPVGSADPYGLFCIPDWLIQVSGSAVGGAVLGGLTGAADTRTLQGAAAGAAIGAVVTGVAELGAYLLGGGVNAESAGGAGATMLDSLIESHGQMEVSTANALISAASSKLGAKGPGWDMTTRTGAYVVAGTYANKPLGAGAYVAGPMFGIAAGLSDTATQSALRHHNEIDCKCKK